MKLLPLILIGVIVFPAVSSAQMNPADYLIIYGNPDGTPLEVELGSNIVLPVWGWIREGTQDSINFMHNPLGVNSMIVNECLGGECLLFDYNECQYLFPQPMDNFCISMIYTTEYPNPYFYTNGDTVLMYNLRMRVTSDPSYYGQTVYPFYEGSSIYNGGHYWGSQDGVGGVVPTQVYGGLFFTDVSYNNGDANGDGSFNGLDVVYSVNYLKGAGNPPDYYDCPGHAPFAVLADSNGDCIFNGIDVTFSVNYLKGVGPAPRRCPDC